MQRNLSSLKEMVTLKEVSIRRRYKQTFEIMPRYASFCGSVNSAHFLNDVTGSRRFLCFEALKIDYNHDVDMDAVYSQAYRLWKNGFVWWLNSDDIARLGVNNEGYNIRNFEEEILITSFYPEQDEAKAIWMTATQITIDICRLASVQLSNVIIQKVGHLLKSNGYKVVRRNGKQVYAVGRINYSS